jgi:uncharacterized membrane protein
MQQFLRAIKIPRGASRQSVSSGSRRISTGELLQNLTSGADALITIVRVLRLATEATGAFWIAVGFVHASWALVVAHLHRRTASFTPARLMFSRYLSLALEFQLASDILSTSIAPSWQEIGKLGATAVIRTGLNYFLSREIREYRERETSYSAELEPSALTRARV